jgi:hypothetical protein
VVDSIVAELGLWVLGLAIFALLFGPPVYAAVAAVVWLFKGRIVMPLFLGNFAIWFGSEIFAGRLDLLQMAMLCVAGWLGLAIAVVAAGGVMFLSGKLGLQLK